MIFRIKLAGKTIEIRSLYEDVYVLCRKYVIPILDSYKPDFIVQITSEDLFLKKTTFQQQDIEKTTYNNANYGYYEALSVYKKIATTMLGYDTLLLHGSVVAKDGNGYMFTAPSGIGKTTRTRLWIENIPGSIVVNGDKPLVRIDDNLAVAYGTPWCGKEGWNNNISVPMRAIFFVERADSDEDSRIEEVSPEDAVMVLFQQTYATADISFKLNVFRLLASMGNHVHFYRLRSKPTAEAIKLAYETARPKKLTKDHPSPPEEIKGL